MSRMTTPCSQARTLASGASPSTRHETSVAWSGSVTTSKRSARRSRHSAAIAAACSNRHSGRPESAASSPANAAGGTQPVSKRAAPAFAVNEPSVSNASCEK
jgi:hypothetical protein